ncbi:hypothetical protein [Aquimarina brevivitae]|uniref:Uncharacterized protein n=1 Tax=Aquimarina brevivitae TaxID=323412 RepID=A0A4Q7NUC8_9FLAO|nr:hypothetical protein [Aquimarina brevivitae]RZS90540.1 hypothetical protein EV197_3334 [Aquimarina brevivitae]
MKLKTGLINLFVIGLLFASCQKEESTEATASFPAQEELAKNWQEADLAELFGTKNNSYAITPKQLLILAGDQEVESVRFIPGVLDNELVVTFAGVTTTGEIMEKITIYPEERFITQGLKKCEMQQINKAAITDTKVAQHAIQPATAYQYVMAWEQKDVNKLEELTSYDGQRLYHFSYPASVVKYMASHTSSDYISLSWGINEKDKMTPVFLPLNADGEVTIDTKRADNPYDSGSCCPPDCN